MRVRWLLQTAFSQCVRPTVMLVFINHILIPTLCSVAQRGNAIGVGSPHSRSPPHVCCESVLCGPSLVVKL